MPRVKIDYIASFSSEDPDNQASNLLSWDVSKKKWLCSKGEPSCSVVLQLTKAVKISSIQIGAHHAALVEVLVGRSENPNEPFQVLVPSSVFLSPRESRGAGACAVARVRSFDGAALAPGPARQRWDRVRLVCSQPYNRQCKYGISFIHIFEPEEGRAVSPAPAAAPAPAAPRPPSPDEEEEEFRPGELFAKHRLASSASADTGAQIRQATSQALKHNSDAATKLLKTPLSKHKPTSHTLQEPKEGRRERDKDDLMYTEDDEKPHAKIDHIVQRHKDDKARDEANTPKHKEKAKESSDKIDKTPRSKRQESSDSRHSAKKDQPSTSTDSERKRDRDKRDERRDNGHRQNDNRNDTATSNEPSTSRDSERKRNRDILDGRKDRDGNLQNNRNQNKTNERRKRPYSDINESENVEGGGARPGPEGEAPLRGVVFAISGYEGRQRAELRALAVALGARYEPAWGPRCTHLICAFPNTPKLRAARRAAGGGAVAACTARWVRECARARSALPWRYFATDPADALPLPPHLAQPLPLTQPQPQPADHNSECDTDDEIEEVLRRQKRARGVAPSRAPAPRGGPPGGAASPRGGHSDDSDVAFVKDERIQGAVSPLESDGEAAEADTDTEPRAPEPESARAALPDIFGGRTFVLDEELARPFDVQLLARYVLAYGGHVLAPSQVEEESSEQYLLCGSRAGTRASSPRTCRALRVRADWLWACHRRRGLCALHEYV